MKIPWWGWAIGGVAAAIGVGALLNVKAMSDQKDKIDAGQVPMHVVDLAQGSPQQLEVPAGSFIRVLAPFGAGVPVSAGGVVLTSASPDTDSGLFRADSSGRVSSGTLLVSVTVV